MRTPREPAQEPHEWRRTAQIRPVIFRDPGPMHANVGHLHIEHRVVQWLLGGLVARGLVHHGLAGVHLRVPERRPATALAGGGPALGLRRTRRPAAPKANGANRCANPFCLPYWTRR